MMNYSGNMHSWSTRGALLLKTGVFADVRVRVDNFSFSCHKIVLATASEFFEKLFAKDGLTTGEVTLSETSPEIFEIFLSYIYTWNDFFFKNLEYEKLVDLLKSSHMWMADQVQKTCEKWIIYRFPEMQPTKLIKLYETSHLLGNQSIMDKVTQKLQCLANHMDEFPEILNMAIDCFTDFLQHTYGLDQCRRFNLAEKWIQKNCTSINGVFYKKSENLDNSEPVSLSKKVAHILRSVDFKKMSLNQFYTGPAQSKILSETKKVDLMYKIATKSRNS